MAPAIKRAVDFTAALLGLIVLAPLLGVVALAIRMNMGPPVLFRQVRPGHKGKPFMLLKFRSMREAYDDTGKALPDADRLTPLGRLLRRSSIDELPQLWNVLRGEMSLVGPRPLRMEYLPRYSKRQARRHDVRPGITGWTQCTFEGQDRTWEEKLESDVWYVENWSLGLDMRILLATLGALARRRRLSDGTTTGREFRGDGAESRAQSSDADA